MSKKIVTVAAAELGMIVRTKAFLITLLLMPLFFIGSIALPRFFARQADVSSRRFAVIDHSGALGPDLARLAEERNKVIRAGTLYEAPFIPEVAAPATNADEQRLALSQRVRTGELWAFAEVPANILDPAASATVRYYSNHPTYEDLPRWLRSAVEQIVRDRRLRGAGVDPELVARLIQPVPQEQLGLFERGPGGEIKPAAEVNPIRAYGVPFGLMYILFLTIFISAPQLMNVVIQEKMTKISEVLLGSVTPFELMLGKLLGGAGASAIMATIYVGGATAAASQLGVGNALSVDLIVMFIVFMVLAMLLYGSIFVAVGAAVSDLKDAQSLITPVMLIVALPLLAVTAVFKSPSSPLSVGLSLFPPATPFMMLLRLALQPPPPLWQVLLGVVLTAGTALACVWSAGKIFRVGILSTGKSASVREMFRWVRSA